LLQVWIFFPPPRSESRVVFIDLVHNLLFVTCFSSAEFFLVSIRRIYRFPGFVSSCCWCAENWSDLLDHLHTVFIYFLSKGACEVYPVLPKTKLFTKVLDLFFSFSPFCNFSVLVCSLLPLVLSQVEGSSQTSVLSTSYWHNVVLEFEEIDEKLLELCSRIALSFGCCTRIPPTANSPPKFVDNLSFLSMNCSLFA
jgi:hypothetical protein